MAKNNNKPVGTIQIWSGTNSNVPDGWLPCDGRSILVSQYPDLAVLFGAISGSFNVPDFRDRLPVQVAVADIGQYAADQLNYSNVINFASTAQTTPSDASVSISPSGTQEGSHKHSVSVNGSVFLEYPTPGSGGFSHQPGGGVSHNSSNNTPGANLLSNSAFQHKHYVRRVTAGTDSHTHSVNVSGSSTHTHTASFSNEQVFLDVGTDTMTFPACQFVVYIIRGK